MSAGTQIHSKVSPHPLRQSYSAQPAEKIESNPNLRNSAPAPSFQALSAKARAAAASPDPLSKLRSSANVQHAERLASLPPKSPVVSNSTQNQSGEFTLFLISFLFSCIFDYLFSYHEKAIKALIRARFGVAGHLSTTPRWGISLRAFPLILSVKHGSCE